MTKVQLFHAVLFGLSLAAALACFALDQPLAAQGLVVFATGLALRSPFTPGAPKGDADA